jgi:uncharacterized repeat protein (TIGR04138 family)
MTIHYPEIAEIVRRDPRYPYEAYEFMFEALSHTQKMLGRPPAKVERNPDSEHHVSGPEILRGGVDLARAEFGLLARTVFHIWGVRRTDDIGELIFNLIDARLMSKTESDHRSDFHDVFDLDRALTEGYTISLDELAWSKRGSR